MALVLADRVKETCSSPGTGTVSLLGAVSAYRSFAVGVGTGNTTYYAIVDQSGTNWETGLGTIGGSGPYTLARTTIYASSNSGSVVNFSSGTQDVWCDLPASQVPSSSASDPGLNPFLLMGG